jgi:HlyD family secretion protein
MGTMGHPPSSEPPSRWRLIANPKLAIGCLIGVVALSATAVTLSLQADPPPSASPLARPPQGVAAIGRLEPKGEVIAVSAPTSSAGAKVEQLFVALGDQIQKGQTIATLDNHEKALRGLDLAQQQWRVAKMRVRQVEAGAKSGEIQAQSSRVEQLRRELEGQMASQSLSIQRLRYELRNARTECQRHSQLFTAGAISASQRDNICLLADTTNQQKLEAESQLQRIQLTLTQQINEAASNQTAVAEVRPIDVAVAKAEAQEALARVKQADADLALSIVRSPRDGQVLRVLTKGGERVFEKGIIELGNTQRMTVVAEVYETDVSRVRVGQKATINGHGIDKKLIGVVQEVGLTVDKKDLLGTDPAAASDARVLEVRIDLSRESSFIVKGMTNLQVDVLIHTKPTKL